jgi:mannosyltransferase OCH1-like enzyme
MRLSKLLFFFASISCNAFEWADFETSIRWQEFHHRYETDQNQCALLVHWYRQFELAKTYTADGAQRIPKIIHQIWLGSPLPEKFKLWCASWKKFNPDWQYRLWTDEDVESFGMINKEMFDATSNYGEKSDIWRYEILERYGGLYADIDEECLRSFDELHELFDLYVGMQSLDTAYIQLGIGIIGAAKNHPLLKKTMELIQERRSIFAIVLKTGPLFFTQVCLEYSGSFGLRDIILPPSYLYPCGYEQKGMPKEVWQCAESYAVHHWAGSWLK